MTDRIELYYSSRPHLRPKREKSTSDRERIEEIFARAICRHRSARGCDWRGYDRCADGCQASTEALFREHHESGRQAKAAIAAAERAGFEFHMTGEER